MKFDHNIAVKYFEKFYRDIFKLQFKNYHKENLLFLLDKMEQDNAMSDQRYISYALATVIHETAFTMAPIEERAAKVGTKVYDLQKRYFPTWKGRGLVQITFKINYEKLSPYVGVDLVKNPQLALNKDIAYTILSIGMIKGLFTGKKLSDYISGNRCNYREARAIVNGTDQAEKIEYYAKCIDSILKAALIEEQEFTFAELETSVVPITAKNDEPVATTITTTKETSNANTSQSVTVEQNIPAPTQYVEHVEPTPTTGVKSWKATIGGIVTSLGITISSIWAWITDKFSNIQPYLPQIIIFTLAISSLLLIIYVVFRFWLVNNREKRAFDLTIAQLHIRANPTLTNVEVIKTGTDAV